MSEGITPTAPESTEATPNNTEVEIATSFVNGKYSNVSDLEKGYENLQKRFGSFDGSPEAYSINEGVEINSEHPLLATIQEFGRENHLSNDGYNKLVNSLLESEKSIQAESEAQAQEVMKALGPNANERVQNIDDFLSANMEADDNMKGLVEAAKEQPGGVELLEAFIAMTKKTAPASEQVVSPVKVHTKEELNKMQFAVDQYGNRKMNDPSYRKTVEEYHQRLINQ